MNDSLVIGLLIGWCISFFTDFCIFFKQRKTLKERDCLLDLTVKQNDEIKYLKSALDIFESERSNE